MSRTNLEGGTGLCVDIGNEGLLGEGVSAEGRRVIHGAPFAAADEVRGGVELKFFYDCSLKVSQREPGNRVRSGFTHLGGKIEDVNTVLGDDEGVDLQVGEVEIDVNPVEVDDECGDPSEEKSACDASKSRSLRKRH